MWPVSRQTYPKQLLAIAGAESLLQQTARRLSGELFLPAMIVSGEDQGFQIERQLQISGAAIESILLEPIGRNTAAAAALAGAWIRSTGQDDLMLLMPSDHVVADCEAFQAAIEIGIPHAERGAIVTFGATPTGPNTQYGYIEADTESSSADGAFPIARFVEKPDFATAERYLRSGRFFWNAGIFLVRASTLLEEMRQFLPASLAAVSRGVDGATTDGIFVRPAAAPFSEAENISIDHAIMEKTARGVVVPVQMGWSDVGAWDAVWTLGAKDGENNHIEGNVLALGTKGSLLRNDGGPLIAAIGLKSMAVVAVRDAVLIAPLDRVAEVKTVVDALKTRGMDYVAAPARLITRWGSAEKVASAQGFRVTQLMVDVGESLSPQPSERCSKHWVVVRGSAELTIGDRVSVLDVDQSAHIAAGERHAVANGGTVPLEIVEIELGPEPGNGTAVRE